MKRIINTTVVTPNGSKYAEICINQGKIIHVCAPGANPSPTEKIIDAQGCLTFPGMIDLLTHGFGHHQYANIIPGALAENSQALLKHGTTAFAPSIMSHALDEHVEKLKALSQEPADGARVLGLHSEGPCFARPGAHSADTLVKPSLALAETLLESSQGKLKFITMAPELPESEAFIKFLVKHGVSVHLGHSSAPPEHVTRYADWGVDGVTHMYNVMPYGVDPKNGLTPFTLSDALIAESRLGLGVICDGQHVTPGHIKLLSQLPLDRVFLETDSMKFAGLEEGTFELYPGQSVCSKPGDAVRTPAGGLVGSSLTSLQALKNVLSFTDLSLSQASHLTSLNPARQANVDNQLGSIEPGKQADILFLMPSTLDLQATMIDGEIKYRSHQFSEDLQPCT